MKNIFKHGNILIVGMLLVCNFMCVSAYAQESDPNMVTPKSKWLDPYPKRMGLMWNVGVDINTNYIWRGLYVGGLGIQPDFMVGYEGLFIDMWWNLSSTDWTFKSPVKPESNIRVSGLNPEVDMTLGFSRWGLTIMFMHMYYFDYYKNFDGSIGDASKYFNFGNTAPGGGITQEWRIKYKVSSKLPLTIMWCTRTWGRDGYMIDGDGNKIDPSLYNGLTPDQQELCSVKRAYSSYFEVSYDFHLPYDVTLTTSLGFTPWKSMYTGFQGDFAVNNLSLKAVKSWDLGEHVYMNAFANLMLNPYDMSNMANGGGAINGGRQFLWNLGCGFYLK